MIKDNHAKLVEYNIRFGDPECQVLMLRMKSDIVELMLECIDGEIKRNTLNWENDYCATVVMASDGYPGQFEKRTEIKGLDKISKDDSSKYFMPLPQGKRKSIGKWRKSFVSNRKSFITLRGIK